MEAMSEYFFDANAIVKCYQKQERGSEFVWSLIENKSNIRYISNWAILEFHSALGRSVRKRELSKLNCIKIIRLFFWDILSEIFILEKLPDSPYRRASELIIEIGVQKRLKLLSGDAIQLLVFKELKMCGSVFRINCY